LSTANGTALAGVDYTAISNHVVNFGFGQNSASVVVPLLAGSPIPTAKTFTVSIIKNTTSGGAIIGPVSTTTVSLTGTDATIPTLTLTAPTAALAKTVSTLTGDLGVTGSADDNVGVAKIQVQVNGGAWIDVAVTPAPTTAKPRLVTFNTTLTGVLTNIYIASPPSGANTVIVRAVDRNGNTSLVKTSTVKMTVKAPVSIVIAGSTATGLVTGTSATGYEVGKVYALTAKQFDGTVVGDSVNAFSAWSGTGISSSALKLTFTMTTDLVTNPTITATYIPNPFQAAKIGRFDGLVRSNTGSAVRNDTHGYATFTVTSKGTFTGSLAIAGRTHAITGALLNNGSAVFGTTQASTLIINRSAFSLPNLTLSLSIDLAGASNRITGTVTDGTNTSDLVADRAFYSTTNNVPTNYLNVTTSAAKGFYTIVLPSKAQTGLTTSQFTQGDSVGSISISPAGVVTGALIMADGKVATSVTLFSTILTKTNSFPLFGALYPSAASATVTTGSISGNITLDDTQATTDLAGTDLLWFRPASVNGSTTYPAGWPAGAKVDLNGAKYNSVTGTRVLPDVPNTATTAIANVDVSFSDGPISTLITKSFNLSTTNVVKFTPADPWVTVTLTATSGLFGGKITPPGGSAMDYRGVILQKGTTGGGYGFVLGTTECGGVSLFHK